MTAFNVVRFRVKPGQEQAFLDFHKTPRNIPGLTEGSIIKTGERSYCLVVKWESFDSIVAARPIMIGMLDHLRPMLEDLGNGLGLTDPVSGEVVVEM